LINCRSEQNATEARLQGELESLGEENQKNRDLVISLQADKEALQAANKEAELERRKLTSSVSLALSNAKKKEQEVKSF
jgi:hypothetical protein